MTRLSKKDIGKENIVFYSACTERWIWSQISVNEINFLLHSSTKLYQFDFSFGSRGPCGASHLAFVSLDSFNFEATTSQTSLYLPKSKQRCASLTWAFALARNSRLHRRVCVRENARVCVCMCLCECGCACLSIFNGFESHRIRHDMCSSWRPTLGKHFRIFDTSNNLEVWERR